MGVTEGPQATRATADRWFAAAATLGVFLLALAVFALLFVRFPVLYDTDSYYHLAIARAYAQHGVIDGLPWARFSLMHEGFGDKEFLFHLLLAPFATTVDDPTLGGRWALAVLNAAVAAALTYLGILAVGRWGLFVPVWVFLGSLDFSFRLIRLRPEILSLLLLLAAAWMAARGRYRLLGLVSGLYALAYTGFHALLGLCLLWFVHQGWARRRWHWPLLLYPVLGTGLGLILHPHFPHNLVVWTVQNIDFFLQDQALNVGREILPQTADNILRLNVSWWLALWVFWRSAERQSDKPEQAAADVFLVASGAFALLYLWMVRFSIYFIPFATLGLLFAIRRRGGSVGRWMALPWRGRVPFAVAFVIALAVGLPQASELVGNLAEAQGPLSREEDWASFGSRVPPGAKVAAEWGSSQIYMFWAPQAAYLNVLNPVFMAQPFPDAYRALRSIFGSTEPDIPLTLRAELDSDYIALSRFHPNQAVLRRLTGDPRLRPLYQGYTLLYEVVPDNADFILDWKVVPAGSTLPTTDMTEIGLWDEYPRAEDETDRALEGFVDATRIADPTACLGVVHVEELATATSKTLEFAPYGPSALWLDEEPLVSTGGSLRGIIADSLKLPIHLEPGQHTLSVLTCPGGDRAPRMGFYLLDRTGEGETDDSPEEGDE